MHVKCWDEHVKNKITISYLDKKYEECLINEIIMHRYAFTGEKHRLMGKTIPIFDDNRCAYYSKRSWSRIMAKAWSKINNTLYKTYAFESYLPEGIEENIPL